MRLALLLLMFVTLTACDSSTFPAAQENISAQEKAKRKQIVLENLKQKPDWLSFADDCPADVMPSSQIDNDYLSKNCENNPAECLKKCKANDGTACYALALVVQNTEIDDENSNALFLRSCRFGTMSGCTNNAAGKFRFYSDNPKVLNCSANTFEKTCAFNDAWGCTMYGLVLSQGLGCKKELDKALSVLPKGCRHGEDDEACQAAHQLEEQIKKAKNNQQPQ